MVPTVDLVFRIFHVLVVSTYCTNREAEIKYSAGSNVFLHITGSLINSLHDNPSFILFVCW